MNRSPCKKGFEEENDLEEFVMCGSIVIGSVLNEALLNGWILSESLWNRSSSEVWKEEINVQAVSVEKMRLLIVPIHSRI